MSHTEFQVVEAEVLSVGTGATVLSPPTINEIGGNGFPLRGASRVRITNTHATQTMYYKKLGTPTSTDNDGVILAGKAAIFALPGDPGVKPQMIASGAATTGLAEYGG